MDQVSDKKWLQNMAPTRLQRLGVEFPFMIGPMVGLSHVAFRELVRGYIPQGVDALLFTEMLSTRRLPSERLNSTNELLIAENEKSYIPQLLGNEERFIAPSIEKLSSRNPWGFDINMGCPSSHVLKHNWGVRLMGDRNYAAEVVAITKKHSPVPVSVKLRGGDANGNDEEYLGDFTAALEDAGADWLTIHARTPAQKHEGSANWRAVSKVREKRRIPVVVNGDIQTRQDAVNLIREYGVDGVMVGRAATARPWILWQIAYDLGCRAAPHGRDGEVPPETPIEEGEEYMKCCLRMADLLEKYFSDSDYALEKMRFFTAIGARWFPFGHSFWKLTTKARTLGQLRISMAEYAAKSQILAYSRIGL